MADFLLDQEANLLGYGLLGSALLFALIESIRPARDLTHSAVKRWIQNVVLLLLDNAIIRWIFPLLIVAWSIKVNALGWGVFTALDFPYLPVVLLSILMLDLAIYLQHRLMHSMSWLWRVHRVHHSDQDYDISTGVRFHPLEAIITQGMKMIMLAILGVPAEAVVLHEFLFIFTTFFVHANIELPKSIDRSMRWILVTPNMHRLHHSTDFHESNSNFGNTFTFWDRWFSSYCAQASCPVKEMSIGLPDQQGKLHGIWYLLRMPFMRRVSLMKSTGD